MDTERLTGLFAIVGVLALLHACAKTLALDWAYRNGFLQKPRDRIIHFLAFAYEHHHLGVPAYEVAHTCFVRVAEASMLLCELVEEGVVVRYWDDFGKRAFYRLAQKPEQK